MSDKIFELVIRFKQKIKYPVQSTDSILSLLARAAKLSILWSFIVSIDLFALLLTVSAHAMFGSIFLIIGATLVFIISSKLKKKWHLIGVCGTALLIGNLIGVIGSILANTITGWHLILSTIIIIFGGSLMYISDKLDQLESNQITTK